MEEIFHDKDKLQKRGKLSSVQVQDIHRIYKVDFDLKSHEKYFDENGDITREDFIKLAQDTKLVEFNSGTGDSNFTNKNEEIKKSLGEDSGGNAGSGLLCCVSSDSNLTLSPATFPRHDPQERLKKIQRAFRKFDLD